MPNVNTNKEEAKVLVNLSSHGFRAEPLAQHTIYRILLGDEPVAHYIPSGNRFLSRDIRFITWCHIMDYGCKFYNQENLYLD